MTSGNEHFSYNFKIGSGFYKCSRTLRDEFWEIELISNNDRHEQAYLQFQIYEKYYTIRTGIGTTLNKDKLLEDLENISELDIIIPLDKLYIRYLKFMSESPDFYQEVERGGSMKPVKREL